jgi:A/G-specific adenine glycosylase
MSIAFGTELAALRETLLRWYRENQRQLPWRETSDPYHVWVSEAMLQQTQVNTVIPYYHRFLQRFPDTESLAAADLQAVLKAWEGLGYYARARNLHRAAKVLVGENGGVIPADVRDFRKLPGVGEYIAAAVQSIAFRQPHPVVDGNVKRVLARLLEIDTPINVSASYRIFHEQAAVLLDTSDPGSFNQALMELGGTVCLPRNPSCGVCPLAGWCQAYQEDHVADYPKRAEARQVPEVHVAVGVVWKDGRVLITQRKAEGLLGGLWEFPGGKMREGEEAEEACLREIEEEVNLKIRVKSRIKQVRHAFTHFKLVMEVFQCDHLSGQVRLNGPVDYRWVTVDELDAYPFPKANHRFLPLLKQLEASR